MLKILNKQKWIKDLSGAWVFYTILPKCLWIDCQFERIARFAPLIGIVIGIFQGIIWLILAKLHWSNITISLITVGIGIWITGGLHIDGLIDTADGIAAGPQKCLEAMRDSRVGAAGVQSFSLVMLLQLASLIELGELAPYSFPIACFWGRCSALFAIGNFKYLDKQKSQSFHQKYWQGNLKEFIPSLVIIFMSILYIIFSPLQKEKALLALYFLSIGTIPSLIIPFYLARKIKGHNGDSYGASVVLVETSTFLLLTLFA